MLKHIILIACFLTMVTTITMLFVDDMGSPFVRHFGVVTFGIVTTWLAIVVQEKRHDRTDRRLRRH